MVGNNVFLFGQSDSNFKNQDYKGTSKSKRLKNRRHDTGHQTQYVIKASNNMSNGNSCAASRTSFEKHAKQCSIGVRQEQAARPDPQRLPYSRISESNISATHHSFEGEIYYRNG